MSNKAKSNKKINKLVIIYLFSLFFIIIIAGSYYLPENSNISVLRDLVRSMEFASLDWREQLRSVQSAGNVGGTIRTIQGTGFYKKLVIAQVDDQTIQEAGSLTLDPAIWVAMLSNFNTKKDAMPSAVLFDMSTFSESTGYTNSEVKLAEELKKYGSAVGIGFKVDPTEDEKETAREIQDYNSDKVQAMKRFEINPPKDLKITPYAKATLIQPIFTSNLAFSGTMNLMDENGVHRRIPLIMAAQYYIKEGSAVKLTNIFYASAILNTAAKLLQVDPTKITFSKGIITLKDANWNGKVVNFTIPVDDKYRMLVNYKARSNSGFLRKISVKDINRAGLTRNPIVLVGYYVQGLTENSWVSPLSDAMMSTDHLAFALGTIMNRDFIYELPFWVNMIYILLFSALVGYLLSKGIKTTIAAFGLSILLPIAVGFGLYFIGYIAILLFIPLIIGVLSLICGEVYVLVTEEREKRFIKTTFSKYVNPDLVNILIQNPDMLQLGGQDKDATMLFSDIRGFTTLSEGMTPNGLISFLNIYLSRMTDIVMETQGTLDKYIGDAVVAFWGTPLELENHALNGCKAAVKMMEALRNFNSEQVALGNKPINIGIGLNSGIITVGNVGSDKKKNYTAIGDNTQLTEDLQDENKIYKTNVIISQFTYERVKDYIIARELDLIYIKGEEKPIRIYELIDMK